MFNDQRYEFCVDEIGVDAEDTITLQVQWRNLQSGNLGTAVYTASWAAAKSDVHSQQRFLYLGHKGEVNIDQAHRGYTASGDDLNFASVNPLYMRFVTPPPPCFHVHVHVCVHVLLAVMFMICVTLLRSLTSITIQNTTSQFRSIILLIS